MGGRRRGLRLPPSASQDCPIARMRSDGATLRRYQYARLAAVTADYYTATIVAIPDHNCNMEPPARCSLPAAAAGGEVVREEPRLAGWRDSGTAGWRDGGSGRSSRGAAAARAPRRLGVSALPGAPADACVVPICAATADSD
ncbi:hypothetical protein ACJJTC_005557 [Scirpophaga incertulas]